MARPVAISTAATVARLLRDLRGTHACTCPLCGYRGRFRAYGRPPRLNAMCPRCGALERHRQIALLLRDAGLPRKRDRILHFAPERQLSTLLQGSAAHYETADLRPGPGITHAVDITATGLPGPYDLILCNHVLEHVDDRAALAELFRLLAPGGTAVLTVPVVAGWTATYENAAVTEAGARTLHYGQFDHLRLYGRDIRDRVAAAGFHVTEHVATMPAVLDLGLVAGETVYLAQRSAT
jgi:SAM-dependent methyltransferase